MSGGKEYIVTCWHCGGAFDALESAFCSHGDPTKICPFCIQCFCDATQEYKDQFIKNSPKDLLEEKVTLQQGDLKLGSLLVKAGKVTKEQLDKAIEIGRVKEKRLGEVLRIMGLLTEQELQMFLNDQKALEEIDLKNFELNRELVEILGKKMLLYFRMVPLEIVQTDREKILRLAVGSGDDFYRLKGSPALDKYVLIPYLADPKQVAGLLEEIEDEEMLVLK